MKDKMINFIKQIFCKHKWIRTIETDGSMLNLKTGIIHEGLKEEFRYCKKCNKKILEVID